MLESVASSGPVEERQCLDEGDAVADATAFLDDAARDAGGDGVARGCLGEVEGESWDCEARARRGGVGTGLRVFAVVVFDQSMKLVSY